MSGIEVAGLALGIVPIFVEIFKSYSATKGRLKAFIGYAQIISDVQLRFQVAAANFSNDCQLLFQAVVDKAGDFSEMVDDPNHRAWTEPSLEDKFRKLLDRDYELCQSVVARIRDVLRDTQAMLSRLDSGLLDPNEPQQPIRQRFRQAFNITRNENGYRQCLQELDQWNAKLRSIREQRCKLRKQRNTASDCIVRKAAPKEFCDIRSASQRLSESLHESWSCTNLSHTGHQAKLSLDAIADYGTVQLDMVIACLRKVSSKNELLPRDAPIWLQVRSTTTHTTLSTPSSIPPAPKQLPPLIHTPNDIDSTLVNILATQISKKRVRFEENSDPTGVKRPQAKVAIAAKLGSPYQTSFAMLDLKATKSVCCHLSKACSSPSTCNDPCLGYLAISNTPPTSKLMFYDAGRLELKRPYIQNAYRNVVPAQKLLHGLRTLHQLTLAHKLAASVLQHHSTSWLQQDWNLREDIAYFTNPSSTIDDDIGTKLQSLHLSSQFLSDPVTVINAKKKPEDMKYMYGIRNLTLANLGVALLEICSQKDIGELMLDHTPHGVISARKILLDEHHEITGLGKRYLKVAQQCIDCDFSCGNNLDDESLQSAVYTDVVCVLEDMKNSWKKLMGMK